MQRALALRAYLRPTPRQCATAMRFVACGGTHRVAMSGAAVSLSESVLSTPYSALYLSTAHNAQLYISVVSHIRSASGVDARSLYFSPVSSLTFIMFF